MANYSLTKTGNAYAAHSTLYSDEYADEAFPLHLRTELVREDNGKVRKYYRLRAKQPHNIEAALSYDIFCPNCKTTRLKMVGRCVNSTVLGLYECPVCSKF